MAESISNIHKRRAAKDHRSIVKIAVRAASRVSGKVRARYIESLRGGKSRFKVQPYVIQQLKGIFVNASLAAHLAGYRRLFLIKRQTPALMKKALAGELVLSELSNALSILQKKSFLDIAGLQEQYNTRALQVLNDVSKDVQEQLDDTFKQLLRDGAHVSEAVRTLGEKFDELGLSPKKPYQLETIFRTQLQMAFQAGRYQAEQHPDIQEILWGYKYVTTGDDRVRDEHAALDGVTLPKDDPFWQRFYPPNGWNCRCQVIPIFEPREIVEPPKEDENGEPLAPDKDFDFNPGNIFSGDGPVKAPPVEDTKSAKAVLDLSPEGAAVQHLGNTSPEFKKLIDDTLENHIPKRIREFAESKGVKVATGELVTDVMPGLEGVQPRGHAAGTIWEQLEGVCVAGKAAIVSEKYVTGYRKTLNRETDKMELVREETTFVKSNRIPEVLAHEYGHAFDHSGATDIAPKFSSQSGFYRAYEKDLVELHKALEHPEKFGPIRIGAEQDKAFLSYMLQGEYTVEKQDFGEGEKYVVFGEHNAGRSETFAELFAITTLGKAGAGGESYAQTLLERFPNTAQHVKDLLFDYATGKKK